MDIKVGALWLNPTVLLVVMFYVVYVLSSLTTDSSQMLDNEKTNQQVRTHTHTHTHTHIPTHPHTRAHTRHRAIYETY